MSNAFLRSVEWRLCVFEVCFYDNNFHLEQTLDRLEANTQIFLDVAVMNVRRVEAKTALDIPGYKHLNNIEYPREEM